MLWWTHGDTRDNTWISKKIMSEHTPNNDDKIPRWFYNTVISMGVMVFVAFGLILLGMIY